MKILLFETLLKYFDLKIINEDTQDDVEIVLQDFLNKENMTKSDLLNLINENVYEDKFSIYIGINNSDYRFDIKSKEYIKYNFLEDYINLLYEMNELLKLLDSNFKLFYDDESIFYDNLYNMVIEKFMKVHNLTLKQFNDLKIDVRYHIDFN